MAPLILTPEQISVSLEFKEGELRLDSRIVADGFGLPNHKSYRNNILDKYEEMFADLGGIFKMPLPNGEIVWYLNQAQVNFAGTLARNTAKSVAFKLNLVKAFEIALKNSQQNLEKQFLPDVPLKQIKELASIMSEFYGDAYAQRLLDLNLKKFYPHLALPPAAPEEKASVSDGAALLTPTELAAELKIFYSTGKPNPQVVNKLLEALGYQEKIAGVWSGTAKAIDLKLCDRKPIETGSRTQKDQLLWSSDVLAILSEHSTAV